MTAEERLDTVTALLEATGTRIASVTALAHPTDPHTVVAHDVRVSSPSAQVDAAARAILTTHAVPTEGLVPWVDPDQPVWDPEMEES